MRERALFPLFAVRLPPSGGAAADVRFIRRRISSRRTRVLFQSAPCGSVTVISHGVLVNVDVALRPTKNALHEIFRLERDSMIMLSVGLNHWKISARIVLTPFFSSCHLWPPPFPLRLRPSRFLIFRIMRIRAGFQVTRRGKSPALRGVLFSS